MIGMAGNLAFAKQRLLVQLNRAGGPATTVTVLWNASGAAPDIDPVTGADRNALIPMSGVLNGFWHETDVKTALRQFAEIQAGDVILDCDPAAPVTIYNGPTVSGTVPLDSLPNPIFVQDGRQYVQQAIGEALTDAWGVRVGNQALLRTLLLRKRT